jgi:hypothetical protein
MRHVAAVLVALGLSGCGQFLEDLEKGEAYQGKGISFRHSISWGVWNTDDEDEPEHKVVYASHGDAHVVVEIFEPKREVPPTKQRAQMFTARALSDLKTFRWSDVSFGAQTSEPLKRTIAEAERSGERHTVTVEIELDSDPVIVVDLFAFDTDDRTIAVAAGGRPEKVEEQREAIEQILTTLQLGS